MFQSENFVKTKFLMNLNLYLRQMKGNIKERLITASQLLRKAYFKGHCTQFHKSISIQCTTIQNYQNKILLDNTIRDVFVWRGSLMIRRGSLIILKCIISKLDLINEMDPSHVSGTKSLLVILSHGKSIGTRCYTITSKLKTKGIV